MRLHLLAIALGSLLVASQSSAQNLLANSQFNAGASSWDADTDGTNSFGFDVTRDAGGSKTSGSGVLSSFYSSINGEVRMSQCVTGIAAGERLFWGTKIRFREGQTKAGAAMMGVVFFAGTNCDGAALMGIGGSEPTPSWGRGIWLESASMYDAPPGTHSAVAFIRLQKPEAGGVLTANIDKVFLARVGTPLCDGEVPTIVGTEGPNVLTGTPGTDIIAGLGGADTINGLAGDDILCGGDGNDTIAGGKGDDVILGEGDDDTLIGGKGNDDMDGGSGKDLLSGGPGNDVMDGGSGNDRCRGGTGAGDVAAQSCEKSRGAP